MRVLDYRNSENLIESDIHQLQCMLKVPSKSERHTPLGLLLHKECQDNYHYLKEMTKLQKLMDQSKLKTSVSKCKTTTKLFKTAAEMYEKEESFRNSIGMCLLKGAVYQHSSGVNTIKKESRLLLILPVLAHDKPSVAQICISKLGLQGNWNKR